jgi:hypothetical protein
MEFHWHDGGRFSSGFVGLTGDCVVRSIAIATGINYRDVYHQIGKASEKTPRNGVPVVVAKEYLASRQWRYTAGRNAPFVASSLPLGIVVVHLEATGARRRGHLCTVIDHVVHDTWNPSDESDYHIAGYWTSEAANANQSLGGSGGSSAGAGSGDSGGDSRQSQEQVLTQKEFDKILHRLRSLDNTANNRASTEGEKRNALRMMQNLMLRHNLSREDITEKDNVDHVSFTRSACPVNGSRALAWEKSLAGYLTAEIFPMTWWYFDTKGHRTLFWFYGPTKDVQNCISLFRELLLTIAASAHLQYGGYTRGSGASYAEGYVRGLPRNQSGQTEPDQSGEARAKTEGETALIQARMIAVKNAALEWLKVECGIELVTTRRLGRNQRDPAAEAKGQKHGAQHTVTAPTGPKRITHQK